MITRVTTTPAAIEPPKISGVLLVAAGVSVVGETVGRRVVMLVGSSVGEELG